jgi:hypothetical protein
VRVIDSDHRQTAAGRAYLYGLVDQHPDIELLQLYGDIRAIVISQNAHDPVTGPDRGEDAAHAGINLIAGAIRMKPIVAGQNAEVYRQEGQLLGHNLRESIHAIDVEIAQMQDPEAVESRRKVGKFEATVSNHQAQGIGQAPAVQTAKAKAGFQERPDKAVAKESGILTGLLACLDVSPAREEGFQFTSGRFGRADGNQDFRSPRRGWPVRKARDIPRMPLHLL